ncbi:acyl-CoA carboxylase epsilon subunit [Streptomyces sp. NPDC048508]|uniref:acyl-CoA carboxylase epsilon subunit n=1 Tax=Streptomyces sp. NPDC048508 TaxID=3365561 RepID=UPI003711C53B
MELHRICQEEELIADRGRLLVLKITKGSPSAAEVAALTAALVVYSTTIGVPRPCRSDRVVAIWGSKEKRFVTPNSWQNSFR